MKKKRLLTNKELYMPKVSIHHWKFEDGQTCLNPSLPAGMGRLDPPPRGWYCWVYPDDDHKFEDWMTRMCPTADITHRFNSGNPMWTVFIVDDAEATLFQLKYGSD